MRVRVRSDLGMGDESFEVLDEKKAYVLRHPEHGTVIVWAEHVEEVDDGEGRSTGEQGQGQEGS